MKRALIATLFLAVAVAVFLLCHADRSSSRAQSAVSKSAPAQIDQHWRVEYGEIEMLEEKLRILNAAGRYVSPEEIQVSMDGKRFVIISSYEPRSEEP